MLEPLGIGPHAESLYVVLAPLNAASVEELSARSTQSVDAVRTHLEALSDLGLALFIGGGQTKGEW